LEVQILSSALNGFLQWSKSQFLFSGQGVVAVRDTLKNGKKGRTSGKSRMRILLLKIQGLWWQFKNRKRPDLDLID
jgi:hypothetical protein